MAITLQPFEELRLDRLSRAFGAYNALSEVSQIKVVVPTMAQQVIDMAMQLHGGAGLSGDTPLAGMWTNARALRLADGPDEVHRILIAKHVVRRYEAGGTWDFGN